MTIDEAFGQLYSEGVDFEEAEEYAEAAEYYALSAFAALIRADFQPGRSMRLAFSHTLEAISADVRADRSSRPERLFETVSPLYEAMTEETDDLVLEGLLHEWFGDAWLMLGSDRAVAYYQQAKQVYERQADPGRNWAFEEEFDYAYWAFESFAEASGKSLPADAELEFVSRIRFKLEFARELVDD